MLFFTTPEKQELAETVAVIHYRGEAVSDKPLWETLKQAWDDYNEPWGPTTEEPHLYRCRGEYFISVHPDQHHSDNPNSLWKYMGKALALLPIDRPVGESEIQRYLCEEIGAGAALFDVAAPHITEDTELLKVSVSWTASYASDVQDFFNSLQIWNISGEQTSLCRVSDDSGKNTWCVLFHRKGERHEHLSTPTHGPTRPVE